MYYRALQNGSDIRGVALEGISGQSVNLTETACKNIARAFAAWLCTKKNLEPSHLKIGIGRDTRLSGPDISKWIADALALCGAHVYDCGVASTPAMFMSTVAQGFEYDGAIMITASHLPYNRNGMKFFTNAGGLEKGDITDILCRASEGRFDDLEGGSIQSVDFMSVYAAHLVDIVRREVSANDYDKPLKGFDIVLDAGNGAGGFFADKVLVPLGADITGSQFLEHDGRFPNHMPNPEDEQAMASIREAVLANGADLGIIFDTDVDRAGAVDAHGRDINRNRLIALMSAIVLRSHPGTTVVTDSITSSGLKRFIESRGGVHRRFKRGYRNVINESIRLNESGVDSQLAIETSGHGAMKENYFLDDGAYMITKILIQLALLARDGKSISDLIADLEEPAEASEIRMNLSGEDFGEYAKKVLADLEAHARSKGWAIAEDNHEGVRISFPKGRGDGWFLLRMSLHDPLMPLNIESDSPGGCRIIARELHEFLRGYDRLDCAKLSEFIGA